MPTSSWHHPHFCYLLELRRHSLGRSRELWSNLGHFIDQLVVLCAQATQPAVHCHQPFRGWTRGGLVLCEWVDIVTFVIGC